MFKRAVFRASPSSSSSSITTSKSSEKSSSLNNGVVDSAIDHWISAVPRRTRRRNNNNSGNGGINNNHSTCSNGNDMDIQIPGDDLCSGFEAQNWRGDRCKKCFRLKDQHGTAPSSSSSSKGTVNKIKRFGRNAAAAVSSTATTAPLTPDASDSSKTLSGNLQRSTDQKSTPPSSMKSISSDPKIAKQFVDERPKETSLPPKLTVGTATASRTAGSVKVEPSNQKKTFDSSKGREKSPSPVPPQRKTKLIILKAEVSVDGQDSDEVAIQTSILADSLKTSASPANSRPSSFRASSPAGQSYKSDASSNAADYDTALSGNDFMSRTVSYESVASTLLDDRSMHTAESGHSERSSTPTESLDETRAFVRSIRAQLEIMENKCAKLEDENKKLRRTPPLSMGEPSDSENVASFKEKIALSESLCQDYRDENIVLKCELRDLQESVSKHIDPEKKTLKDKLTAAEQLCEELLDENDNLKKEVQSLQHEVDEMHDQYREEEIEEFRDLQRELEQTAKNCRILQFKLRKSERKNDQTEADRQHLEEKLKELLGHSGGFDKSESPRLREVESELRIAKEVSVRLHNELEALDEKRCKLEDENFYFREKIREMEAREKLEQGRAKYEQKKFSASSAKIKDSAPGSSEFNVPQLLRDLHDALERETDLRDQLKFAEADIQQARKKLVDLETENEGLTRQVSKLTTAGSTNAKGKPIMKRSYSEGHAQIELELAEHEAQTLKSKLDKIEKENECMISRISLLEKEAKKSGGRTDFSDDELRMVLPDTYYKQKIKILEEELEEWKLKFETMEKAEADQDAARKHGLLRGRFGSGDQDSRDVDLKRKLQTVEHEAGVLRQRILNLENENERLTGENKRLTLARKQTNKNGTATTVEMSQTMMPSPLDGTESSAKMKEKIEQMEKDIYRFINRIAELEKEKETLSKEIERRKKLESIKKDSAISSYVSQFNPQTATISELREKIQDLLKENATLGSNIKNEQQKTSELETQLSDYKQVISMSENQKLITMASKVEVLTNQLKEAQNRFDNMHKKLSGLPNGAGTAKKYEEALKERVESLEKTLAEERAKIKIGQKQREIGTKSLDISEDVASVELSQCSNVLATVEDQVDRIYKQVEQLETQQKSPRASPLLSRTKPTSQLQAEAADEKEKLLKDIGCMKSQLLALKTKLREKKKESPDEISISKLDEKLQEDLPANVNIKLLQKKCQQQEKIIGEFKEQLDVSKQERMSAYHECETATARLLQTEDRWNKELEKLKESYENQVKDLKYYLQEAERVKEEKSSMLQERTMLLQDKNKRLTEVETKAQKLENDLKTKHRFLEEKMEAERKKAKEFETKYQKLETLYDTDRQKLNSEKEKFKQDLSEMKKRYEETQQDFEKLKASYDKKEQLWQKDKQEMESKVNRLQDEVKDVEKKAAKKAAETSSAENKKLLATLEQTKKNFEAESDSWKLEKKNMQCELDQKSKEMEQKVQDQEKTGKDIELLKSRVFDQKQQLEETRKIRDEAREELSRWQQTWARERSELAHKMRQEEKVQQAEHQALQLKYESRIKVMEDTSKRLQSQLTQTRRERDQLRENLVNNEKKVTELRQKYESDEKELRQRLNLFEKQSEKVEDLQIQLDKNKIEIETVRKNYDTDRRLWNIEKRQLFSKIEELEKIAPSSRVGTRPSTLGRRSSTASEKEDSSKLVEESMQVANELRKQIDDMKTSYDNEVDNLQKQIDKSRQEWNQEKTEMRRKLKDLQENIKVLEIDRRNMLSTKDQNELDKNMLQSERDTLMEKLHDSEIHQLANKYKLDKVSDHLTDAQAKVRYGDMNANDKRELQEVVKKILEQLMAVRDDMGKTKELGKALESIDADETTSISSWKSGGEGSRKASTDRGSTDRDSLDDLLSKERLAPVGGEAEDLSVRSAPIYSKSMDHSAETLVGRAPAIQGGKPPYIYSKSSSVSSDLGLDARLAELRLRSPSPSPRKITNYPDPPPSMIFNVKNVVEYDSEGRRHWTRRSQMKRSISLDPNPANLAKAESSDVEDNLSTSSHVQLYSDSNAPSEIGTDAGSTKGDKSSISSQSPSTRRKVADIFATLRKSTSKERKKFFGDKKSHSIERSDVGHTIGAIGVQVLPPAVTPLNLPNPLQTSEKVDDPPKGVKGAARIFEKFRARSSSRGKQHSTSVDEGSAIMSQTMPTNSTTTTTRGSAGATSTAIEFGAKNRTTSEENVTSVKGSSSSSYSSSSAMNPTSSFPYSSSTTRSSRVTSAASSSSSSAFRRISTSYNNVRSLSSKYLHRP